MIVLSFGGGVQTVALAAMACLDKIARPDLVVFSDTQWEKKSTMQYLSWFIPWAKAHGMEIVTTTKGNIRADALNSKKRFASMPLWTETGYLVHNGKEKGGLRRQCTNEYKIEPVNRVIRSFAGLKPRQRWKGSPVNLQLGISIDEYAMRGKASPEKWIKLCYPLVDLGMTRGDCVEWLKTNNIEVPPKSACLGCPFTDNPSWMRLKIESPEEFEAACNFDDAVRRSRVADRNPVYLHPSLKPLREADLGEAQSDFFMNECAGRCRT